MKKSLLTIVLAMFVVFTMNAQPFFSESFSTEIPLTWTVTTNSGDGWFWDDGTSHGYGQGCAIIDSDNSGGLEDGTLASPVFDCSSSTNIVLNYNYNFQKYSTGEPDSGYVEVFDGTDWVWLKSYHTDSPDNGPQPESIDVTAYAAGNADFQVRFGYEADYMWYFEVSDFELYGDGPILQTVTFTVTDGTNPLENANVNIDGSDLTTNASGQAAIYLVSGNYQAVTGLLSYVNDTTDFTVVDAAVDVDVILNMQPYTVTFNCNINDSITSGYFVAGTDTLSVTGSMAGWSGPGSNPNLFMTDDDGDGIYTVSIHLASGDYEYKYFKNAGWSNGEWDGGDNRAFTVADADLVLNDYFGDIFNHVGINEISSDGIKVFPNPSNGVFNINVENDYNLEVFDITGRVINTRTLTGNTSIELNTAGVYFLRFSNEKGSYTQKVIVR